MASVGSRHGKHPIPCLHDPSCKWFPGCSQAAHGFTKPSPAIKNLLRTRYLQPLPALTKGFWNCMLILTFVDFAMHLLLVLCRGIWLMARLCKVTACLLEVIQPWKWSRTLLLEHHSATNQQLGLNKTQWRGWWVMISPSKHIKTVGLLWDTAAFKLQLHSTCWAQWWCPSNSEHEGCCARHR